MMRLMRTTIDLPDDLHALARRVARDRGTTLSDAVAELMRRGLNPTAVPSITISSRTGLPVVDIGRTVTEEDVRSLDDD